jgi:hypothetical protein
MKSKCFIVVLFMFFALLSPAFAGHAPKESGDSLSKTTDKNMFHLEVTVEGKNLAIGNNSADILVKDTNGKPVTGAYVYVKPHVARHGESTFVKPLVTEKGEGLYNVKNIYLDAQGDWILKVRVRKGDKDDSATFDFPGVKRRE